MQCGINDNNDNTIYIAPLGLGRNFSLLMSSVRRPEEATAAYKRQLVCRLCTQRTQFLV